MLVLANCTAFCFYNGIMIMLYQTYGISSLSYMFLIYLLNLTIFTRASPCKMVLNVFLFVDPYIIPSILHQFSAYLKYVCFGISFLSYYSCSLLHVNGFILTILSWIGLSHTSCQNCHNFFLLLFISHYYITISDFII